MLLYSDWLANVPTMLPAYTYALTLNLCESGEALWSYTVDAGGTIYVWTTDAVGEGYDWTKGEITGIFDNMLSIFNEAYKLFTPNGGVAE